MKRERIEKLFKRILRWAGVFILKHRQIVMRPDEGSRKGLEDLMNAIELSDGIMVEVGSYRGESAEVFLASGKVSRLYCVDPWKPFYDSDDGAAFTDMKKVEADFDRRHASDERVVKSKGTIDDFVARFGEGLKVDLIYIDGLHTYEGVKHDIEVTLQRIKPRIAIAGHDYNPYWPCYKAIREIFGEPDMTFCDGSWVKFVKPVT